MTRVSSRHEKTTMGKSHQNTGEGRHKPKSGAGEGRRKKRQKAHQNQLNGRGEHANAGTKQREHLSTDFILVTHATHTKITAG